MIFCSRNEDGVPAWKLVLENKKTVTRRVKPMAVGKEFAVCPGRGKKAVCRARVVSCMSNYDWIKRIPAIQSDKEFRDEAHCEGFGAWETLWDWLGAHYDIEETILYRIEFEKIPGSEVRQ